MKVNVLLFAHLREIVGDNRIEIEIKDDSVGRDILDKLVELYPEIEKHRNFLMLSMNNEFIASTDSVNADSEIAVFPPVSGG